MSTTITDPGGLPGSMLVPEILESVIFLCLIFAVASWPAAMLCIAYRMWRKFALREDERNSYPVVTKALRMWLVWVMFLIPPACVAYDALTWFRPAAGVIQR